MTKKINLSELAEFDPSKYPDDDEAIADYIRLAIEDGDPGMVAAALGDVARARGMTQVAQSTGKCGRRADREVAYHSIRSPDGSVNGRRLE
jgi:probable addiction module antidote protein